MWHDLVGASCTHVAALTGFDEEEGGTITKWRVENSWGTDKGDDGYFVMTDDWFTQFNYQARVLLFCLRRRIVEITCFLTRAQVVVDKSMLDAATLAALDQDPVVLPAWDPMGALAHGSTAEEALAMSADPFPRRVSATHTHTHPRTTRTRSPAGLAGDV